MKTFVKNLFSPHGNPVPNQYEITAEDGARIFQSYKSIIAQVTNGKIILDKIYWNYSRTTSKYLYIFLNLDSKEVTKMIKKGEIQFADLN
jgi:hypothetical protein